MKPVSDRAVNLLQQISQAMKSELHMGIVYTDDLCGKTYNLELLCQNKKSSIWIIDFTSTAPFCIIYGRGRDFLVTGYHFNSTDTSEEMAHRICQHVIKPIIAPARLPTEILQIDVFGPSIFVVPSDLRKLIWIFCDLECILRLEQTSSWMASSIRQDESLWVQVFNKLRV
eukprot:Gregarina_sp_Poly_1__5586@NODE_294_length_9872_cov_66_125038_g254_i0_p5_GENE_NODE_294_length_9872_cov_66_125038_g254_i0NODE_294_length_9872_cov_66_125038_g254_i0_p5_ORF_typecomplete_len171_score8_78_NODE_294_length_9872_cov_66_125038_g254_i088379349